MKIIGVNGSPKKSNSTTGFALERALKLIEDQGLSTQQINLGDYNFSGCIDCGKCRNSLTCSINDDFTNKILPLLADSEIKGFLFASPVYFGGITGQLKSFFDRCVVFRRNGFMFEHMVAGGLTVGRSRNGGQELATMDIVRSCLIQGMIIVPDSSPTSHFGANLWSGHPDSIENDEAGLATLDNLAKNIAGIVKKLNL
ncbi:MAG: flavodoxin family protein [Spirochaetales bacterium]|nr:flavodoxin family protein [Spirochaetales bacterium]